MSAVLIDFAARRPVVSAPGQPLQPNAAPSLDEQVKRRYRWERQALTVQAARLEWCAINARLRLATRGSEEHARLMAALRVAGEAWLLAQRALLRTPSPTAVALAWKERNGGRSPELGAIMAADEAFVAALPPRRRSSRRG